MGAVVVAVPAVAPLAVGGLPEVGAALGFEVQFNEDVGGGVRDGKVAWHATSFLGDYAFERTDAMRPVYLGF
ncbi:MAG TPA: hypothetical protein VHM70_30800 [Polyangiaceae bacterium]|nr:hypothetical protein [Polyangiaceae bacterium]